MRRARPLIYSVMLLQLAACAANNGKSQVKMTFENTNPIPIYVAAYEVTHSNTYDISNFSQGFALNPEEMIMDYLENRFTHMGMQGKLQVMVEDISLTHKMVNSENKMGAFLGVDRHDNYDIQVVIRLTALGVEKYEKQDVRIRGQREISISEHVSLAEREDAQKEAMVRLIDDLDTSIRKVLSEQFRILRL